MVARLEKEQKLPARTDYDVLNELIDWYEKFKPKAGLTIPVHMGPGDLARMISYHWPKDPDGKDIVSREIPYRNRTLVATGIDKARQ